MHTRTIARNRSTPEAFPAISFITHLARIINVHPKYVVGDAYPTETIIVSGRRVVVWVKESAN
ncbi:MAG: hypothetical protein OZ917_09520 [Candidatus Brocadiaceae bacterium]|nr:hypothetical protein [Candidatus Brocadiaceae bacterium]